MGRTAIPHPAAPLSDPPQSIEVEAQLALGRLDGALAIAGPTTLRLLAARLLRSTLITALRQERHSFTDQRFHARFAGLATLSDWGPRNICAESDGIVTNLGAEACDLAARAAF